MVKIGITGGAGFIGSNLSEQLISMGHQVQVLDNLSNGSLSNLNNLHLEFILGDILDTSLVNNFFEQNDYVFHLAALGSVPRSIETPVDVFNSNVIGTLNVLESARKFKKSVAMASSSSVYGGNTKIPKSELDWLNPLSPYASSKLSCEGMFSAWAQSYDLNLTVYRLFNVFGPKQKTDGPYSAVIPKWTSKIMRNEPIEIFGDGLQKRDFTYVGDVVKVLINGLEKEINRRTPINLAFGNQISVNDLLMHFKRIQSDFRVEYQKPRNGDVLYSASDGLLISNLFPNVQPQSFFESLKLTWNWYLSQNKL